MFLWKGKKRSAFHSIVFEKCPPPLCGKAWKVASVLQIPPRVDVSAVEMSLAALPGNPFFFFFSGKLGLALGNVSVFPPHSCHLSVTIGVRFHGNQMHWGPSCENFVVNDRTFATPTLWPSQLNVAHLSSRLPGSSCTSRFFVVDELKSGRRMSESKCFWECGSKPALICLSGFGRPPLPACLGCGEALFKRVRRDAERRRLFPDSFSLSLPCFAFSGTVFFIPLACSAHAHFHTALSPKSHLGNYAWDVVWS